MNKITKIVGNRLSKVVSGNITHKDTDEKLALRDCAISKPAAKPIFFDMIHSNNAARIR
eukprot:CAMPEP_0115316622 /NCGR_PEP_ID=MMETSP0270-20121206/78227_1 /TAXON_ID=71861 /ORGANISM="Scrippsiella trochoidea, Strain CCMP3099" /LENGTH=58 /DNA_ID=CAMNT_0002736053 /DNA_START=42 /DNA_END=215 /DNA_ORIENTATION=+